MSLLLPVLSCISAVLLGVFFVKYLTTHPVKMGLHLFFSCLSFYSTITILYNVIEGTTLLITSLACIFCFIVGYLLMAKIVLNPEDTRKKPILTRKFDESGLGHTAIIYFTHGEPETYNPIGWIHQFQEFDEQKIKFIPFFARPFFLYSLRKHYLIVGKSNHRQEHIRMMKSLEKAFKKEEDFLTKVYISFLDDEPSPDLAIIQALNEGASNIIVSEVFLTISNHTAAGKKLVENLNLEKFGITPKFTGPLWDSALLKKMFIQRANLNLNGTDKSNVGIILVGHGQPKEWDIEFKTSTDQGILFRKDIMKEFEKDGYLKENLVTAWMMFKNPKVENAMEILLNREGIEKIFYFPSSISADAIHSQYDLPKKIHNVKIPNNITVKNLGAWNDDPIVISAIKEKIDNLS